MSKSEASEKKRSFQCRYPEHRGTPHLSGIESELAGKAILVFDNSQDRQSAQGLPLGVDDEPVALDLARFGVVGLHTQKEANRRPPGRNGYRGKIETSGRTPRLFQRLHVSRSAHCRTGVSSRLRSPAEVAAFLTERTSRSTWRTTTSISAETTKRRRRRPLDGKPRGVHVRSRSTSTMRTRFRYPRPRARPALIDNLGARRRRSPGSPT